MAIDSGWVEALATVGVLLFSAIAAAISHGISRAKQNETEKRVATLEAKVEGIGDLKTEVRVLSQAFAGFQNLSNVQLGDVKHDVKNIQMSMDKLTDLLLRKASD